MDGYLAEAQQVANAFNCDVGIYPTGCDDGRFRHWEWKAANSDGHLPLGAVQVIHPETA